MGHLNSLLASGGGNVNKNLLKIQMPGGLPGGMLKLRFDWYITVNAKPTKSLKFAIAHCKNVRALGRVYYID